MLLHIMKKKRGFNSDFEHYGAIILLSMYIFIVIICLVALFAQPNKISQSSLNSADKWAVYDKATDQMGEVLGIAPNVRIFGSPAFRDKIESAIEFLSKCSPQDLSNINKYITGIYEDNGSYAGADISYGSTNMQASSNLTRYLPGNYSLDAQIFWYSGAIVHEARHSWQFLQPGLVKNWNSRTPAENNAVELDAVNIQIAAMKKCVDYVPYSSRSEAENILQKFEELDNKMKNLTFNKTG